MLLNDCFGMNWKFILASRKSAAEQCRAMKVLIFNDGWVDSGHLRYLGEPTKKPPEGDS